MLDFLLFLFLIITNPLFSGTTGKISGVVSSSETNAPLIGVNVVLANTSLGTVTDSLGTFALLNIPPGDYSIQVSMIGYADFTLEDVIIKIDQTAEGAAVGGHPVIPAEFLEADAEKINHLSKCQGDHDEIDSACPQTHHPDHQGKCGTDQ